MSFNSGYSENMNKQYWKLVFIIPAIGLILISIGLLSRVYRSNFLKTKESKCALVTEVELNHHTSGLNFSLNVSTVTVKYDVDSEKYETKIYEYGEKIEKGDYLKIYYDKSSPETLYTEDNSESGTMIICGAIFIAVFIFDELKRIVLSYTQSDSDS